MYVLCLFYTTDKVGNIRNALQFEDDKVGVRIKARRYVMRYVLGTTYNVYVLRQKLLRRSAEQIPQHSSEILHWLGRELNEVESFL